MRRFTAVPILALALAACANEPVPTAAGDPGSQLDQTRLGIYEAMARELAGTEGIDWKRVVIVSTLCENAGDAVEPKGCDEAFSAAEQDELALRLADLGAEIEFIEDPTPLYDDDWFEGPPDLVVVRLGTIVEEGGGVQVGGSYGCGGLCGSGTTYLLEESPAGWEVVGTTGPAWIA
jgi:hypothetical protein